MINLGINVVAFSLGLVRLKFAGILTLMWNKQEKINKANDQNCTYLSVVRPTKKYRQNESKLR